MISRSTKDRGSKIGSMCAALTLLASCLTLISSSSTAPAATVTVNPVKDWTPVLSEFRVPERVEATAYEGQWRPPPYSRIEVKKKRPRLPDAWRVLEPMVKIKLRGAFWDQNETVISGWRPWVGTETQAGTSGIGVMRSDKLGDGEFPVRNLLRKSLCPVRWTVNVYTGWRFPGDDTYKGRKVSELTPVDQEFQELIKKKIVVREYSFRIYRVEGDWKNLNNLRNRVSPEPYWKPSPEYLGYERSLAEYEAKSGGYTFSAIPGIYEVQLKMKLYFPELDDQKDTQRETELEGYIRFISTAPKVRPISIETGRGR